jgi:hypothetical protein
MSRLVFDRVVVRGRGRVLGPIRASFGAGVHGIATHALKDLDLLEERFGGGAGRFEGSLDVEGPARRALFLGDLLPLPAGHVARRFASLTVGLCSDSVIARSGIDAASLTDHLAGHEAFAFALALAEELPEVGAIIVPSPHAIVAPQEEREAARRLRALAARGFPVVVLLAPALRAARWVDDLVTIDATGLASEPRTVAALTRTSHAFTVRGEGLERVAARMVHRGFELAIDPRGRELIVRSPLGVELERVLTEAIAAHDGAIDEVVPCA